MNDIPKLEDLLQLNFFCMILISLTENSLAKLLVEVFKKTTKVSNFYVTTITFARSTTSKRFSKLSDAVLVTRSFQRLVIQKEI